MELKVNEQAKKDIQEQIHFYNKKQKGLGKLYHNEVKISFDAILKNPYYQIRYYEIHCFPLKKFPAMVHYSINDNKQQITIHAVFHTTLNPEKWKR